MFIDKKLFQQAYTVKMQVAGEFSGKLFIGRKFQIPRLIAQIQCPGRRYNFKVALPFHFAGAPTSINLPACSSPPTCLT
jgi:hypothetical protein